MKINPPSAGLEAGRRVEEAHSSGMPRICWQTNTPSTGCLSNATPPTVRTALTISRPQNCGSVFGRACNRIDRETNSPFKAGAYWFQFMN
jgi:hypothetical protein